MIRLRSGIYLPVISVIVMIGISAGYRECRSRSFDQPGEPIRVEQRRWVMGTQLRIVIEGFDGDVREVMDKVFEEAQRWNALLSDYDSSSPLSEVNAHAGMEVEVPEDLYVYLERCESDKRRTDGIFNVAVGQFVRAHRGAVESTVELDEIMTTPGVDALELSRDESGCYARLVREGTALDPGGNGKGFAVDAMASILHEAGVSTALIDFGGSSFYGVGAPKGSNGWPIAVTNIDGSRPGVVVLKDRALSVSASLRRDQSDALADRAVLAGHIIDPRNGELVMDPRTVVVLSPSAVDAEVLSTTLVVRPDEANRMAGRFPQSVWAVFPTEGSAKTCKEFAYYFQSSTPGSTRITPVIAP